MEFYSPLTFRPIKKGSKTYLALLARGYKPIPKTTEYARLRSRITDQQHHALAQRCGKQCHLLPRKKKYAICPPDDRSCEPDDSMIALAARKAELVLRRGDTSLDSRADAKEALSKAKSKLRHYRKAKK